MQWQLTDILSFICIVTNYERKTFSISHARVLFSSQPATWSACNVRDNRSAPTQQHGYRRGQIGARSSHVARDVSDRTRRSNRRHIPAGAEIRERIQSHLHGAAGSYRAGPWRECSLSARWQWASRASSLE